MNVLGFCPLAAVVAQADILAPVSEVLALPADVDLRRGFFAALVALAVIVLTLPRGRRRLASWPLALLLLAPLPLLVALLFPGAAEGPANAILGVRFFLLASLLQSVLLFVTVCAWERIGRPLPRIFLDVLRWLVLGVALVAILYDAGLEAGNLFAGSAVVTAVLGFALKDTLGNVFAGLAIHAEHPFEVGDWIQYDANPAHIGRVVEINWRATKVLTLDEAYVIIPNGQLAQASIRNFTKPEPWSRRSVFVVTPYDVPPQRVQAIILEAIRGSFGVLEQPAPSVVTNDFKERGVEHWVRFFTAEFDKRDRVDGQARDRIWYALSRHGIEIPVATHAVRLTTMSGPPPAPPPEAAVDRRAACLARVELFKPLGDDLVRRLAAENPDRVYAAGEQVIRAGASADSLFVIIEGRVEVTAAAVGGPPARVAELGPGDYFGEMSLMTGAPRYATVTTVTEARLVEIGRQSFRGVLAARPDLVKTLGAALQRRLAELQAAVAMQTPRDTPDEQDLFRTIREFFAL